MTATVDCSLTEIQHPMMPLLAALDVAMPSNSSNDSQGCGDQNSAVQSSSTTYQPLQLPRDPPAYSSQTANDAFSSSAVTALALDGPPPPYEPPPSYHQSEWTRRPGGESTVRFRMVPGRQSPLSSTSSAMSSAFFVACAVFWLCGFLFGAIAFAVAVVARRRSLSHTQAESVRRLTRVSLIVSITGIIVGIFLPIILVTICVTQSNVVDQTTTACTLDDRPLSTVPPTANATTTSCTFLVDNECFHYASNLSIAGCLRAGGRMSFINDTLICHLMNCADYVVLGKYCFRFRVAGRTAAFCRSYLNGMYLTEESGSSCYYNTCPVPGIEAPNGVCYQEHKRTTSGVCENVYHGFYANSVCYYG